MNAVRQDPAAAVSQGLFKGIAVVIDDGITRQPRQENDSIHDILGAIEAAGGHALTLTKLPTRDEELDNFANAAFFVMDWNLHGSKLDDEEAEDGRPNFDVRGLQIGQALEDDYEQENVDFLKKLRERRHAPVFIFTNDDVERVTEVLTAGGVIGEDNGSHILIKHKSQVGANLFEVLDEWIKQTPSALVLKEWERNQTQAINQLFGEFHDKNKYWPVIFWNGFKKDGVPPAPELGELISRMVGARMKALTANLDEFSDNAMEHFSVNDACYRKALYEVLQAERLLPKELLDPDAFSTGDLYYDENKNNPRYLLNIRPACDCVKRENVTDSWMHLIKGTIVSDENLAKLAKHDQGNFAEHDGEAIVFALHNEKTILFKFRTLHMKKFADVPGERVGRVLAPFITRVAERYAAYSHRSGLPRVPAALMPPVPPVAAGNPGAANQDAPACGC